MVKEKHMFTLRAVGKNDLKFLFDLLSERDERVNISHKKMPTFEQHKKFVLSKPYSKWYVIINNKIKIGSIYLSKQDEIGIFVKKEFQNKGVGKDALELLMKKNPRSRYLANVNPKNKKSIEFFKNNKFKILQHTYELSTKSD